MIKEFLKKLESSEEFADYKKRNPDAYLVSCFMVFENKNLENCSINFYSAEKDKVTAFEIQKELKELPSGGIFKKDKEKPGELKLDSVKISLKEVFTIIDKHNWNKIFITLSGVNPIWNLSYFDSLIITNIKIDAETGKIIGEKTEPITNFKVK